MERKKTIGMVLLTLISLSLMVSCILLIHPASPLELEDGGLNEQY